MASIITPPSRNGFWDNALCNWFSNFDRKTYIVDFSDNFINNAEGYCTRRIRVPALQRDVQTTLFENTKRLILSSAIIYTTTDIIAPGRVDLFFEATGFANQCQQRIRIFGTPFLRLDDGKGFRLTPEGHPESASANTTMPYNTIVGIFPSGMKLSIRSSDGNFSEADSMFVAINYSTEPP